MTNRQRAAEAEKVSVAYQIALTQLGVKTVEEALELWSAVPATRAVATSDAWLAQAIHLVMTRRTMARALAMAYYRLIRALLTGRTVADPDKPEPEYVTLAMLRQEFKELAGKQTPPEGADAKPASKDVPAAGDGWELADDDNALDEEHIPVEDLDGDSAAEAERLERLAEEEAVTVLDALGPANLEEKLTAINPERPAVEVDAAREEAHFQAGTRQAAAAERVVLDGARGTVWNNAERDKRVIGYVRMSRTGTPCGWCAMLISRGPVYRSESAAEYADGDKYHDNCHCVAEPVFSREQYASALFDVNRKYHELWPQVTKGLSGKAAVSAWRRFIRQEQQLAQEASRSRALEADRA
ncbi:VG15 protein [Micromonospora sp. CB01531]|uniref:VG15 protein n=1 Tax=Micromonospora sp. CB01531 TaxID=1718947 RepID=UPI00093E9DC4|nr:hypothetical protein [Micromonospora sp. CB01531]OKI45245.1 hypothetical protein A6A27_11850 [Micromonospora sp. CB01531]